jgi:hypothetical protein
MDDPATRSRTVLAASTSPGAAAPATRVVESTMSVKQQRGEEAIRVAAGARARENCSICAAGA